MKLKEVIKMLEEYNPEAEVYVIAHCQHEAFTLSYGGSEGVMKHNAETVSFYVDRLNQTENV